MTSAAYHGRTPERLIDVLEPGRCARKGRVGLILDRDVTFSTTDLETYAFARWEEVIYDAMVLAAVVEYADRIVKRPPQGWTRRFSIRVPVHDARRWSDPAVSGSLDSALRFLTGDEWSIVFIKRMRPAPSRSQGLLSLPAETEAVLPYSNGMDSRAVAGILGASLGGRLLRVRVGSDGWVHRGNGPQPFALVPYDVPCDMPNREASGRSRGFKFALISGIAAYLTNATEIVVPESGQGSIGPAILIVGHAWPDYRNHPLFTARMERFLGALLGKDLHYVFPRIWHTKGETLREFVATTGSDDWTATRSCWRGNRWSSVNGKRRQCGVCAACMLRRVAVFAAGLEEHAEAYVCGDMRAASLESAIDPAFTRFGRAFREYAIAGVRYMADLATMAEDSQSDVARHASLLSPVLGLSREEAHKRLNRMLLMHSEEWNSYMTSLGPRSFATQWVRR